MSRRLGKVSGILQELFERFFTDQLHLQVKGIISDEFEVFARLKLTEMR